MHKLVNTHKLVLGLLVLALASFADTLSLEQCLSEALKHNKQLQIQQNNVQKTQQKKSEVRSKFFPNISINADYKYFVDLPHQLMPMNALNPMAPEGKFNAVQFGVAHNINANLQMAIPIYNPQLFNALQSTELATEMQKILLEQSREQVVLDISNLYYNAQIIAQQLSFLTKNLQNAQKIHEQTQLLHAQEMIKSTDVEKAQLQYQQIELQIAMGQQKSAQILNAIKVQMGWNLDQNLQIDTAIALKDAQDLEANIQQNTTAKLLSKKISLAQTEVSQLRKKNWLPSLHLIGALGTQGFGYDKAPNEFLDFYALNFVGLQLSYPLFAGNASGTQIKQKSIEIQNLELQRQALDDKNTLSLINLQAEAANTSRNAQNLLEQIALASKIHQQTELLMSQGQAHLIDVISADLELRQIQQSYLQEVISHLQALLQIKQITGQLSGGFHE
ncbi:MAG: TolC family protein [Fibrobacter sp.]|nr:TolC family protein [Fibrobacter sp.]